MDYQKVIDLVHAAKAIIFDPAKTRDIAEKGRADYVTGADRGVQNFLEAKLKALTPDITLFAEEKINERPDPRKSYWILDPIDGTTNLIHDYKHERVADADSLMPHLSLQRQMPDLSKNSPARNSSRGLPLPRQCQGTVQRGIACPL